MSFSRIRRAYLERHGRIDFLWTGVCTGLLLSPWVSANWPAREAAVSLTFYATVSAVAGSLLGFSITTAAVLVGLMNGPELRQLRRHQEYGDLFADYRLAVLVLGLTTVGGLVATLLSAVEISNLPVFGAVLWLALLSCVVLVHTLDILRLAVKAHSIAEEP